MEHTKGELKPCPFCGGEASIGTVRYEPCDITRLNNREKGYFVNCQICSARNESGISYATEEEAIKHWNTRVSHDDLLAAIAEAYKEGYVDGYADGINADESCVPETTYFKNDFARAWKRSDTKAVIAKAQPKAGK